MYRKIQESQSPATACHHHEDSGLIHHPCPAIFKTDSSPVCTNIKYFPVLRNHCDFVPAPQAPQTTLPVTTGFQGRPLLPTGRTVLSQTNQVPVPNSIQQTGVCHHDHKVWVVRITTSRRPFGVRTSTSTYIPNKEKMM